MIIYSRRWCSLVALMGMRTPWISSIRSVPFKPLQLPLPTSLSGWSDHRLPRPLVVTIYTTIITFCIFSLVRTSALQTYSCVGCCSPIERGFDPGYVPCALSSKISRIKNHSCGAPCWKVRKLASNTLLNWRKHLVPSDGIVYGFHACHDSLFRFV